MRPNEYVKTKAEQGIPPKAYGKPLSGWIDRAKNVENLVQAKELLLEMPTNIGQHTLKKVCQALQNKFNLADLAVIYSLVSQRFVSHKEKKSV